MADYAVGFHVLCTISHPERAVKELHRGTELINVSLLQSVALMPSSPKVGWAVQIH
jgi:hypothetical protein